MLTLATRVDIHSDIKCGTLVQVHLVAAILRDLKVSVDYSFT